MTGTIYTIKYCRTRYLNKNTLTSSTVLFTATKNTVSRNVERIVKQPKLNTRNPDFRSVRGTGFLYLKCGFWNTEPKITAELT